MTSQIRLAYNQVLLWLAVFSAFALVWQLRFVLPLVHQAHPASDVLAYVRMENMELWFGATHLTWRIGMPLLSLIPTQVLPLPFFASWMLIQWILFLGMAHLCWRMHATSRHRSMSEVGWLMLIPTLPVFWRYLFLPMTDIAVAFFVALLLYLWREKRQQSFFIALIIGIFFKEIMLLMLVLPLWDALRIRTPSNSVHALVAIVIGLAYVVLIKSFQGTATGFYPLQPEQWWNDWLRTASAFSPLMYLKHLLSAFGLLWVVIVWRWKSGVRQPLYLIALLFHCIYVFTPENSPRLAFMLLPFLAYEAHPAEEEKAELS